MLELLLHLLLTSALLMIVAKLVDGVEIRSWGSAFLAAIVLGLVTLFVVVKLLQRQWVRRRHEQQRHQQQDAFDGYQ